MTSGESPTSEDVFRWQRLLPGAGVPDEAFVDLFADIGRASVPPRIVAVVTVDLIA